MPAWVQGKQAFAGVRGNKMDSSAVSTDGERGMDPRHPPEETQKGSVVGELW